MERFNRFFKKRNSNAQTQAVRNAESKLIRKQTCERGSRENKWAMRINRGYPGGCAMPRVVEEEIISGLSSK